MTDKLFLDGFDFSKFGTLDSPRSQQLEVIPQIVTALKKKKFFILEAPTGCHAKGTKILMYDGSTKNVEEIVTGDLLMGPDSLPRKVLNLHFGKDEMYKIIPNKGNSFVVNSEHILSLQRTNNKKPLKVYFKNDKPRKDYKGKNPIVNLSIKEYIEKSKTFKHTHKLYKSKIEFSKTEIKINPYILGLWLGDGNSAGTIITNIDKEIINEIYSEANQRNLIVEKILKYGYRITGKRFKNTLQNDLKYYNLINNKHIPFDYKINSTKNRLELLAGLIDTDGSLDNNCYEITQKRYDLILDIQFLANSLGFGTNLKNHFNKKFNKNYFRLSIFGKDIDTIPVKVKRKKIKTKKAQKDAKRIGFKIERCGVDNYYGFEVDKDNLYLMDNFIVTHNSGKSMIATTLCKYYSQNNQRTSILCHQKVLQDQYLNEKWKDIDIKNVTSSNNYICTRFKSTGLTCSQVGKIDRKHEGCKGGCQYVADRNAFVSADIGLTNMQYFLNLMQLYPVSGFHRDFIVIDEAHSIEDQFLNFISVDVNEGILNNKFQLQVKDKFAQGKRCIDWVKNTLKGQLEEKQAELKKQCENAMSKTMTSTNETKYAKLSVDFDYVNIFIRKLDNLIANYNEDTWVFDVDKTNKGQRIFSFRPIMIDKYTKSFLFSRADRFLLMSATILGAERFCENVGIDMKDGVEFVSLPSLFPLETRPIYYHNSGQMSKDKLHTTLPNMISDVEKIMTNHKNEKGIIFCHTYKIGDYLKENINGVNGRRLLLHTSKNRQAVLEEHMASDKPTVLLTPSLSEGIDLKQDMSRFQILCKIPFPYLGDERVMKKMKKLPWWYAYKTVKTVVQSLGRSVRSEDDYAISYILDGDWAYFYKKNEDMFPVWIKESLTKDVQKIMFLF